MRVLIATADPWWAAQLRPQIANWGFDVFTTDSAGGAIAALSTSSGAGLALLDRDLPPGGALEVCRLMRRHEDLVHPYLLVVNLSPCRSAPAEALDAGADDFLPFPADPEELRARLEAGRRLLSWHQRILQRRQESAIGLCPHCKRACLAGEGWRPVEVLLAHLGVQTSPGTCPGCYHAWVEPELLSAVGP
jgi:sigma-B regulation protein RsbU (phosphoserine phosphatase)